MNSEESKEQKILHEINNLKEELKSNKASDIIKKLRKEWQIERIVDLNPGL